MTTRTLKFSPRKNMDLGFGKGTVVVEQDGVFVGLAPVNVNNNRAVEILTTENFHVEKIEDFADDHKDSILTAPDNTIPMRKHWKRAAEILRELATAAEQQAILCAEAEGKEKQA